MEAAQTRQTDGLLLTIVINFFVIVGAMFMWRFGIVRYNIEAKRGIARVEKQVFAKVLRLPIWRQRLRGYLGNALHMNRTPGRMRAWDKEEK